MTVTGMLAKMFAKYFNFFFVYMFSENIININEIKIKKKFRKYF